MEQRVSLITLGVHDPARARRFYEALGWQVGAAPEDVVFFQAGGMIVALWDRGRLAEDSAVADGGGWGGVTMAYNTRSAEEVDQVIATARGAGARIAREPGTTFWGGYSAIFVDPDGHPWEVAHNPGWSVHDDGSVHLPASSRAASSVPDSPSMDERLEVSRAIAADAPAIFRVLSDPRGHVAIDSTGMLMGSSGEPAGAVGDRFVVHMDREALNDYPLGLYDVTVRIVTFEPDTEIAWTVEGQLNLGHVYGYRLAPVDGGTLVTSYYDWSTVEQSWKDAAVFPVIPERALAATLGILARTVAPGRPRPAR